MSVQLVHKQQGISLIEVLVALLIASIGLLGIVAIQTNRVQLAHQEIQLSTASILVTEMAERLRANVPGVVADLYSDIDTSNTFADSASCNPCTEEQIRNRDANEWKAKIAKYLVQGKGTIKEDAVDNFTISITWKNTEGEDSQRSVVVAIKELVK